jgi:hypothetical protein
MATDTIRAALVALCEALNAKPIYDPWSDECNLAYNAARAALAAPVVPSDAERERDALLSAIDEAADDRVVAENAYLRETCDEYQARYRRVEDRIERLERERDALLAAIDAHGFSPRGLAIYLNNGFVINKALDGTYQANSRDTWVPGLPDLRSALIAAGVALGVDGVEHEH